MLLPFTFDMGPVGAFAFLIGMLAVTTTSDTIPSVLFAVPGTVGSQATIIDGHAMAKKGAVFGIKKSRDFLELKVAMGYKNYDTTTFARLYLSKVQL